MKLFRHALVASLTIVAFAQNTAHAEEYQGVLQFQSSVSRSDVRAQAIEVAHASDPYADAVSSIVAAAPSQPRDRGAVRAEAVARAHEPNQNLHVDAFANSRIPAYYDVGRSRGIRHALGDIKTSAR